MTGTDVATSSASVPALPVTPAVQLTADDIALPKLKIAQSQSKYVVKHKIPLGDLIAYAGEDDPDYETLYSEGSDEKLRFHVLHLTKGKSVSEDGELTLYDYDDPAAPPEAWTTYKYYIAIPSSENELPHSFLLSRSGKPSAQKINMVLAKTAAKGPAYEQAFEVGTAYRESPKGSWYVPQISHVEADPKDVEFAASLAGMIPDQPTRTPTSVGEEPAI